MGKILLIEDDVSYSRIIKNFLEKNGFVVATSAKVLDAKTYLKSNDSDLIITDFRLPDGTGLNILSYAISLPRPIPVILITNYSDIRTAVKAMKMGAVEYITKPINPDELLLTVKDTFSASPLHNTDSQKSGMPIFDEDYIAGKSESSVKLEEYLKLVSPTDLNVIVLGETGTGKEFISKRIHNLSKRKSGPFVAVDCGALSKDLAGSELFGHVKGAFTGAVETKSGHFETAKGGTIFLDEVGNLSYEVQIKLLRAIQERTIRKIGSNQEIPIDVRILAATNEDLVNQVKEGNFREDLYHRLNEFSITALPLRARGVDLLHFAHHFLTKSNRKLGKAVKGFKPEVEKIFLTYSWPGNLRELKNIIRRAVLLTSSEWIGKDVLPEEIFSHILETPHNNPAGNLKKSLMQHERDLIIKTLEEVNYNKSKASKILGMDRKTLYSKIEKYGIS